MFTNKKKEELIQIRVNLEQKNTIKELAQQSGMSMAEYILTLIEKDYKQKKETKI